MPQLWEFTQTSPCCRLVQAGVSVVLLWVAFGTGSWSSRSWSSLKDIGQEVMDKGMISGYGACGSTGGCSA